MNQSATDKDSFMFYTSVETGQSQYPTKNVEYIGTFTANPSALRGDDADDDDYKYTMIKLDNKHQNSLTSHLKIKTLHKLNSQISIWNEE